jgi:peptidyl-prolyl cis-trans isomerase A (cyclophilin A)
LAVYAQFMTNEGNFTIRLFDAEAPNTVANFVGLAEGTKEWTDPRSGKKVKQPYYDGIIFHRVIDGFMIQGGDPLGKGIGGPGYKFADEFHPKLRHSKEGMLSMANSGPNTNGGQFFITLGPTPHLGQSTLGVRRGRERHGRRAQDRLDENGTRRSPVKDVVIQTIKIERK